MGEYYSPHHEIIPRPSSSLDLPRSDIWMKLYDSISECPGFPKSSIDPLMLRTKERHIFDPLITLRSESLDFRVGRVMRLVSSHTKLDKSELYGFAADAGWMIEQNDETGKIGERIATKFLREMPTKDVSPSIRIYLEKALVAKSINISTF